MHVTDWRYEKGKLFQAINLFSLHRMPAAREVMRPKFRVSHFRQIWIEMKELRCYQKCILILLLPIYLVVTRSCPKLRQNQCLTNTFHEYFHILFRGENCFIFFFAFTAYYIVMKEVLKQVFEYHEIDRYSHRISRNCNYIVC